jgi:trimeric autotransporter adhesin
VFGRRRRREAEAEAAREAERRELFSELAKRPETVCPFLGSAQARTKYVDGVSEEHRCYAFGDPAELSAEQQLKVCLQRGYGNCPRYLRGVLVIPTEELEALRRPAPVTSSPPRRAQAPAAAKAPARESGIGRRLVLVAALLLLVVAGGGAAALYLGSQVPSSAVAGELPGGTEIGAELLSISPPDGGSQRLHATASIGAARSLADTTLIYVLDVSRTTRRPNACGGDQNGDGVPDTVLDCEIASAARLNAEAITSGSVSEVGLVGFAADAVTADLEPADGVQPRIKPDVDEDDDRVANVVEAMQSAFTGTTETDPVGFRVYASTTTTSPTTDFSAGITVACEALATAESPNRVVVFLSDGLNLSGEHVSSVLPCSTSAVFHSIAMGTEASCSEEPQVGGLRTIAELTGGNCTEVPDLTKLPEILQKVVVPQLTRIELTVDGGEPVDVSASAGLDRPRSGPATIEIDHRLAALGDGDHRLCLTVYGSDAGGQGSIESCATARSGNERLTSSS